MDIININIYTIRSTVPSFLLEKLRNTNRANVLTAAPLNLLQYKQE